ncbi:MAG: helix-turn-helix domain-containing protein [Candidatus Aenigmarchaeota archaeon]|nr:helix-turn-helix domain-containing protein [Candidatus Aenigmarchaeota archaeon]
MNMLEKQLMGIGLTEGEIRVYLALLDLGMSTTGPIIDHSRVSSSKAYGILNRLMEKGLVSYVIKSNIRHYEALDPRKILDFLTVKEREIQEHRQAVKEIIPTLSARRKLKQKTDEARVYTGYEGIRSYFDEIFERLQPGEERLVLGAESGYADIPKVVRFFHMQSRRFAAKGIRTKIIFNEGMRKTSGKRYEKMGHTQVRYLKQVTPASIGIQGDNVDILLWDEKKIVLFAITSREVAESYREFFRTMWGVARK